MTAQLTAPALVSPAVARAIVEQYFAASRAREQKVEQMVACFTPDCIVRDPVDGPTAHQGQAQLTAFFQTIAQLFAEVGLQEEFVSINDNQVAVKWRGQGTGHNGRTVTFEGIDIFEIHSSGKLQAMQAYWNPAAMITELTA
jgi:steroid Delta-isomerase